MTKRCGLAGDWRSDYHAPYYHGMIQMSIVNCVVYHSNGGVFGRKAKKEKDLTQSE